MRVLVIDDENDICLMVSRILKSQGIECDCAHTVKQGVKKSSTFTYQLFIIDINLPDGTGLDLIVSINNKYEDPNIVTISAHDDSDTIEKAMSLGARKFVKKPFTKAEILALV